MRRCRSRLIRLIPLALVVLLVGGVLAACGSSDEGDTGGSTETIKIGTVFPMTGDVAQTGIETVNGMKMAAEEINAAGGIKSAGGAKLEIVVGDTQGKPDVGVSETQRLIQQDNVSCVVGTAISTIAATISQRTERLKTPFLIAVGTADELTEKGYKYTFRIMPKSSSYAKQEAEFVRQLPELNPDYPEVTRVATIHEDSDFGAGMAAAQAEYLGDLFTTNVAYSASATDLTTQLNKVKVTDPQVVITSTYLTDAIVLGQARTRLGMTDVLFCDSGGGAQDPGFVTRLGDSAETWCTTMEFTPLASDESQALSDKFEEKYGRKMNGNSGYGYQAMYVLAKAFENAGSGDREALREAMSTVKLTKADGDTIILPSDEITFGSDGQMTQDQVFISQVQDGQLVPVYPKDYAYAEVTIPK